MCKDKENIYDLFDEAANGFIEQVSKDAWPPYDDISVASKEDISKKTSSFDEWVKELEIEDNKKSHDDGIDALTFNINSFLSSKNNINHPDHYKTKSGLEAIDVIKAFTEDLKGVEAVDTANIIKYICRWKKKNGLEDLKKAQWYLNDLIKTVEGDK